LSALIIPKKLEKAIQAIESYKALQRCPWRRPITKKLEEKTFRFEKKSLVHLEAGIVSFLALMEAWGLA